MSTQATQTVVSGHIIKLMIGGREIGRAQSIDARRSFNQDGIYEIGSIMPQEHVALRYEGSITLDKFRIRTKSLKELGLAALGKGILNLDVINIVISDKQSGATIMTYSGCSLQEYSEHFRVNSISGENATWVYLDSYIGSTED